MAFTATSGIPIRAGRSHDWPAVRNLLDEAGLPIADLNAESMQHFLIASGGADAAHSVVGAAALQSSGKVGLLRSLVIASSARSKGLGSRLVREIECQAKAAGITELWLLTIDAAAFFAGHGYEASKRDAAPTAIRETPEFSKLCPDSAVLMFKSI